MSCTLNLVDISQFSFKKILFISIFFYLYLFLFLTEYIFQNLAAVFLCVFFSNLKF